MCVYTYCGITKHSDSAATRVLWPFNKVAEF